MRDVAGHQRRPDRTLAMAAFLAMAEREGFEPPIRLPVCRISSAVHSTTLPPLRSENLVGGESSRPVFSGATAAKQERMAASPIWVADNDRRYSSQPVLRSSEDGPPPRNATAKTDRPHSSGNSQPPLGRVQP